MKTQLPLITVACSLFTAGSCFAGLTGLTPGATYDTLVTFGNGSTVNYTLGGAAKNTQAGIFTTTAGGKSFTTWCFELTEFIDPNNAVEYIYEENFPGLADPNLYVGGTPDSILTQDQLKLLGALFDAHLGAALSSVTGSRAMQLAVWEITYDALDLNLDNDGGSGFSVTNGVNGAKVLSQSWLGNLPTVDTLSDPTKLFGFLGEGPTANLYQNQISAVPEPSVLGLQALFVLGVLFGRRRPRR